MKTCPCKSQKNYLECCGLALQKKIPAKTPETLMRSRYTAFVEGDFDYIRDTMRPPAALKFDDKKSERVNPQWLGLEVIASSISPLNPALGFVEFEAKYRQAGKDYCIHEKSEFHLIDGAWYYVDGVHYA